MSEVTAAGPPAAGRDREAEVAAALADLEGLADVPLDQHHERLARSHEVLHRALSDPNDAAGASDADPGNASPRH